MLSGEAQVTEGLFILQKQAVWPGIKPKINYTISLHILNKQW